MARWEAERELVEGGASASLVKWDYNDVYADVASDVSEATGLDPGRMLFLESLRRGDGAPGDGERLVRKAAAEARAARRVLVAVAASDRPGGQERLSAWYERIMDRVPTGRGAYFANVFSSPPLRGRPAGGRRRGSRQAP